MIFYKISICFLSVFLYCPIKIFCLHLNQEKNIVFEDKHINIFKISFFFKEPICKQGTRKLKRFRKYVGNISFLSPYL